jgi:hypothetical protein
MLIHGVPRLSWDFFSSFPSRRAASAGILSAWVGTILVMLVTALWPCRWASPPASTSRSTRRRTGSPTSSRSTSPTWPACRRSSTACWRWACSSTTSARPEHPFAAGLTLALLILPVVIVATREAIRAIPQNIREGAYACGATKWQTVSAPHPALFAARHHDRRDHRPGARDRRNGPDHHHRRLDLHRLPAAVAASATREAPDLLRLALRRPSR